MKIDLGQGRYLEPDEGPRNSPYHQRIVGVVKIHNTLTGHFLDLACGHRVMTFGKLEHAEGVILCPHCRDGAQ